MIRIYTVVGRIVIASSYLEHNMEDLTSECLYHYNRLQGLFRTAVATISFMEWFNSYFYPCYKKPISKYRVTNFILK